MGQVHELYSAFTWEWPQERTLLAHLLAGGVAQTHASGFRYQVRLKTDPDDLRQTRDGLAEEGLEEATPLGMVVWTVWDGLVRRVLQRHLPVEQLDAPAFEARLSFVAQRMHQAVLRVTRQGHRPYTTPSRPSEAWACGPESGGL